MGNFSTPVGEIPPIGPDGLLGVAHVYSHSTPLMGRYFFSVNFSWDIKLLAHELLLLAQVILFKPHGLQKSLLATIVLAVFLINLAIKNDYLASFLTIFLAYFSL